jgi:AraC family transcriptional regulator, ethanolamine operon transcriptional activator
MIPSQPSTRTACPARLSRRRVVERAAEFLRAHVSEPVRIAQVCEAAGVSERSLRNAFYDVCGMSPTRYVRWERLNDVRRALQSAPNLRGTVTTIATEYGFFELGRFATIYKAVFGETPSETLRGAGDAETSPPADGVRWLRRSGRLEV